MEGLKDVLAVIAFIVFIFCILYGLGLMAASIPIAATIR